MLIEQLFDSGIMTMGPSRDDPTRQVGVLAPGAIQAAMAARAAAMDSFRWIAGDWTYENPVPPTQLSPAYTDSGKACFSVSSDGAWVCIDAKPYLTFDPLSRQWIYVLMRGAFGMLRSKDGWVGNRIVFQGLMTMIGIECNWRMTWIKHSDDEFGFVNEEQLGDRSWAYIDEWRYRRVLCH